MNPTDEELEAKAERFERMGWLCGGVVVLGVIAEALIAFSDQPNGSLIELWGSVGADALIALGVAGEIMFAQMGYSRQKELTRRANDRLGEAEKSVAQALERAATAELETETLKAQQNPRNLTEAQFNELKTLKGQIDSVVITTPTDFESTRFAAQVSLALQIAGIRVLIGAQRIGMVWQNFYLVFPEPKEHWAVEPLYQAFHRAGLSVGCGDRSHVPMGDLPKDIPVIMIGEKSGPHSGTPPFMAQFSTPSTAAQEQHA